MTPLVISERLQVQEQYPIRHAAKNHHPLNSPGYGQPESNRKLQFFPTLQLILIPCAVLTGRKCCVGRPAAAYTSSTGATDPDNDAFLHLFVLFETASQLGSDVTLERCILHSPALSTYLSIPLSAMQYLTSKYELPPSFFWRLSTPSSDKNPHRASPECSVCGHDPACPTLECIISSTMGCISLA